MLWLRFQTEGLCYMTIGAEARLTDEGRLVVRSFHTSSQRSGSSEVFGRDVQTQTICRVEFLRPQLRMVAFY